MNKRQGMFRIDVIKDKDFEETKQKAFAELLLKLLESGYIRKSENIINNEVCVSYELLVEKLYNPKYMKPRYYKPLSTELLDKSIISAIKNEVRMVIENPTCVRCLYKCYNCTCPKED